MGSSAATEKTLAIDDVRVDHHSVAHVKRAYLVAYRNDDP
jgi:hypothetical protein